MIKARNLYKRFDDVEALGGMNIDVTSGAIYGLIGTNGSGKTTFLRLAAGVYCPDEGEVTMYGENIYENAAIKDKIFFLSDDQFFFSQCCLDDMARFYRGIYSGFDMEEYKKTASYFPISREKKINTFSKGMKRQAEIILALSAKTEMLLIDEAFDGLDPVIRRIVRQLVSDEMGKREFSLVVTSHNLRELEDLCDHVGLLHKGKVLFEQEIDELKLGFCKVQAAFRPMVSDEAFRGLKVLQLERQGSLVRLIAEGSSDEVTRYLERFSPVFAEAVPLTLEEVFINKMEAVGYDYNNILF